MIVEETFYRPPELAREARTLPAATYNVAHMLLARAASGSVFVPIRPMQFLAVLDREEIVFIDREGRRMIELAWCRFRPQARAALTDPVPYDAVYYAPSARQTMQRLHAEFTKALATFQARGRMPDRSGRVVKLDAVKP
jgi:hypothetical protein